MNSSQNVYQQASSSANSMQRPLAQEQPQQDGNLSHFQNNQINADRVSRWTVEQTAAWVRTYGILNQWQEAEEYGNSFRSSEIKGYMLQHLTTDSLKSELGIYSYGHRLELIFAIKCIFEDNRTHTLEMLNSSARNYPMFSPLTLTNWDNAASPMSTSLSPQINVGTPRNHQHHRWSERPFAGGSDIWSMINSSSINSDQVSGGVGSLGGAVHLKEIVPNLSKYGRDPVEVPTYKVKSERAELSNPFYYIALCKVEFRAGWSANTKILGDLRKGAVVMIDLVKGRFGRLVEKRNREYYEIGWVPFYTHDGQPCVVRYFPEENELY